MQLQTGSVVFDNILKLMVARPPEAVDLQSRIVAAVPDQKPQTDKYSHVTLIGIEPLRAKRSDLKGRSFPPYVGPATFSDTPMIAEYGGAKSTFVYADDKTQEAMADYARTICQSLGVEPEVGRKFHYSLTNLTGGPNSVGPVWLYERPLDLSQAGVIKGASFRGDRMSSKLTEALDAIADRLEAKGLMKEASEIDVISNTLEKGTAVPGAIPQGRFKSDAEIMQKYKEYMETREEYRVKYDEDYYPTMLPDFCSGKIPPGWEKEMSEILKDEYPGWGTEDFIKLSDMIG